MKTFMRNILFTGALAIGANGLFAAPAKTAVRDGGTSASGCSDRGPYIKNLMAPSYRMPCGVTAAAQEFTRKQVKRLAATAETREDHLKLAAYYTAEAARLEANATAYEEAAANYRRNPIPKNLAAPSTPSRYEFIAKGFRNEAKTDRALAASHQETARNAVAAL